MNIAFPSKKSKRLDAGSSAGLLGSFVLLHETRPGRLSACLLESSFPEKSCCLLSFWENKSIFFFLDGEEKTWQRKTCHHVGKSTDSRNVLSKFWLRCIQVVLAPGAEVRTEEDEGVFLSAVDDIIEVLTPWFEESGEARDMSEAWREETTPSNGFPLQFLLVEFPLSPTAELNLIFELFILPPHSAKTPTGNRHCQAPPSVLLQSTAIPWIRTSQACSWRRTQQTSWDSTQPLKEKNRTLATLTASSTPLKTRNHFNFTHFLRF